MNPDTSSGSRIRSMRRLEAGMEELPRLGEILVQSGVIDEFQLSAALEEHERSGHRLGIRRPAKRRRCASRSHDDP